MALRVEDRTRPSGESRQLMFSTLIDFRKTQVAGDGNFKSAVYMQWFNCDTRKIAMGNASGYSGQMAQGKLTSTVVFEKMEWESIPPDGKEMLSRLIKQCAKKEGNLFK
jgi:hypothetical protein